MSSRDTRGLPHVHRIHSVAFGCVVLGLASSASSQEADWPSNAEAHPGEIVYSREVPYGTATRRFVQGEAKTVTPDQSELIENSLLVGLEPLSDGEQAAVSAPILQSIEIGTDAVDAGLSPLAKVESNAGFVGAEGASNSIGNVVSQSLSVIPSALSAIGHAVRGEQ